MCDKTPRIVRQALLDSARGELRKEKVKTNTAERELYTLRMKVRELKEFVRDVDKIPDLNVKKYIRNVEYQINKLYNGFFSLYTTHQ